jgi:hypothetical protein
MTYRRVASGLLLLPLVLVPVLVVAAPFDGSQGVDAYNGLVVSFGRATAMGGAYAGVAEGLDGAVFNPASVAHRSRSLDRAWDFDVVLNWIIPGEALAREDLGNEGHADPSLTDRASVQMGVGLQLGRLGLAFLVRAWSITANGAHGDQLRIQLQDTALSGGWSFWRDQLAVGADLVLVAGMPQWAPRPGDVFQSATYSGLHLRAGALYRPVGQPFRLGLALDPGQSVTRSKGGAELPVTLPRSIDFPWTLSLGASMFLGRNGDLFNELPVVERRDHPEWDPGPDYEAGSWEPVLLSAQLDVAGRTPGAVSPLSYVHQQSQPAMPSGAHVSLEPHLGAEWTAIDRWLVVRGGSYLEPSRTGAGSRVHGTFGFQVRIPVTWLDLKASFTADLASRFNNYSIGVGLWNDRTPRPLTP